MPRSLPLQRSGPGGGRPGAGGPSAGGRPVGGPASPSREPLFNAPAPVLLAVASILGSYLLQTLSGRPEAVARALSLDPRDLQQGRWWALLGPLVAHASWMHAILNALGALAFGTPVARRMAQAGAGVVRFVTFYLVCGAIASLGLALLHWGQDLLLVGASGAVSGLMGASSRLLERRTGLSDLWARPVLGMAAGWLLVNLVMALGWLDLGGGGPIAWEAHLVGYAAGLLLIGPALAGAPGRRREPPAP